MCPVEILTCRSPQTLLCLMDAIRAAREQRQRVLVLVPEQFTLQAERELIRGLAVPGLMDVDVLSPSGLVRLVRERAGGTRLPVLDERGQAMALSMAMVKCQEELTWYREAVDMPGLPERLRAVIAEMTRAGLTPDTLAEAAARMTGSAARCKLQDISRIWREALALTAGRFAQPSEVQAEAVARLPMSGLLERTAFFVCGFDVLQPGLISLILGTAAMAVRVCVAMCMDHSLDPNAGERLFAAQRASVLELMRELERQGIPAVFQNADLPARRQRPALAALSSGLFADVPVPGGVGSDGVTIHTASDTCAEAAWAAACLRAWHEAGIPWSRMSVTMADASALPPLLSEALEAAGIPHYLARKDSAARHGLSRMLLGALRAACQGYRQADVLAMARSGFVPLSDNEALRLENYALENGINRHKWLVPFTRGEQAEEMETLRLKLIPPVVAMQQALRTARDARESASAVWQLLNDMNAYQALLNREEELLRRGMQTELSQNRQIWQLILNLLDQIHALLGGQRAVMRHLARLVEAGLNSSRIASLPPQADAVMVGEAGHLMTGDMDCLLLMGMQDGVTVSRSDQLLTEAERQELSVCANRRVGLSQAEQNALRRSDLYRSVALPQRELTLTCAAAGADGAALRPSELMRNVRVLLPDVKQTGGVRGNELPPLSPAMTLDGLAVRLRAWLDGRGSEPSAAWQAALAALLADARWRPRAEAMLAALHAQMPALRIDRKTARALMRWNTVSISRLEQFAACPQSHFIRHFLQPVERRDFTFEADDRGNFFHAVLQRYTELAAEVPGWPDIPDERVNQLLDTAVEASRATWEGGPLTEDAAGVLLGQEYVRTVRRAAWLFTRHARKSAFSSTRAEVSFGPNGTLPPLILELADGHRVALQGVIDRVDDWQNGQVRYRRLVDYKSSEHTIDPVQVRHGLQLQLLLYMLAATQQGDAQPAGMFYFLVKDPLVETDSDLQAEAEDQLARALRLRGVALSDVRVVKAMNGGVDGEVLQAVFKKDGSLRKGAMACDPAQMQALMQNARRIAQELALRMRQGEIDAAPARTRQGLVCERCDYRACCPRDSALSGLLDRDFSGEDPEAAWLELTQPETDAGSGSSLSHSQAE